MFLRHFHTLIFHKKQMHIYDIHWHVHNEIDKLRSNGVSHYRRNWRDVVKRHPDV